MADQYSDADMLSDEDSFGAAMPPPPPSYPHPDDVPPGEPDGGSMNDQSASPDGDKFNDEYDDEEQQSFLGRGTEAGGSREDPPQEIGQGTASDDDDEEEDEEYAAEPDEEYEDEDDVDFDLPEDQSLEIPPTSVVQRMVLRENVDKTDRQRNITVLGAICCCLFITIIIIIIGFSTDLFTKETTSAVSSGADIAPTSAPTADSERVARVRTYLEGVGMEASALDQSGSPQSQAFEYLTGADPLGLDPDVLEDALRLKQRYGLLAGLWYASPADWAVSNGWALDADECSWVGVDCGSVTEDGITYNAVTSIALPNNNVQGLTEEIGQLTHLTYLDLNNNVLTGNVPSSIVMLEELEELYLYDNFLQGEWPADLSAFTNMTVLYASHNRFTDDIRKFFTITSLEILILDHNELVGTLDGVSDLENIGTCQNLSLMQCFHEKFLKASDIFRTLDVGK